MLWITIYKFFKENFLEINFINILLFSIIIFQYLGLPILFFKLDPYRLLDVSNSIILFKVFIATSISTTLLILGYFFFKKSKNSTKRFNDNFENSTSSKFFFNIILFTFCLNVLTKFISSVGFFNLALISALGFSDASNLTVLRSEMSNAFDGYTWYYLFMNKIMIFSSLFFFAEYLLKKDFKRKIMFYLSLITCFFSLIMGTEKAPLIYYLGSLFLIYCMLKNKGFISRKIVFYFSPIILLTLTIFYLFFMNVSGVSDAFFSVFSRALTGAIQPAYHYLEFFPNVEPFLLGRSLTNPGGIFPYETYNLTQELMSWYNSSEFKSGVVGSMPTIYWGEIYANFSFIGILILPFFIGFLISFFESLIKKFQCNTITLAFYIWLIIHIQYLSVTSLSNYIFDIYSSILFFLFIAMNINYKKLKIVYYRNEKNSAHNSH